MDANQNQIITETADYLGRHIRLENLIEFIRQNNKGIITEEQARTWKEKGQRGKSLFLDKLKKTTNGFNILYNALKATNHSQELLKILEKGLSDTSPVTLIQTKVHILSSKITSMETNKEIENKVDKISDDYKSFKKDTTQKFDAIEERLVTLEKDFSSSLNTMTDLHGQINSLTEEFRKIKADYNQLHTMIPHQDRDNKDTEIRSIKNIEERLTRLVADDRKEREEIRLEILGLKEDFRKLKDSIEKLFDVFLSIKSRYTTANYVCDTGYTLEHRSEADQLTERDIRPIAKTVAPILPGLAEKMGVNLAEMEDGSIDEEGTAEKVITKWIESSTSNAQIQPTWKVLNDMLCEIDKGIAKEVDKLR